MIHTKTCKSCGNPFEAKSTKRAFCDACKAPKPVETRVQKCCPMCNSVCVIKRGTMFKTVKYEDRHAERVKLKKYFCRHCGADFDSPVMREARSYPRKGTVIFLKTEANMASQ